MSKERLTWGEIKQKYPHQYVGLTDIEYGDNKGLFRGNGGLKTATTPVFI